MTSSPSGLTSARVTGSTAAGSRHGAPAPPRARTLLRPGAERRRALRHASASPPGRPFGPRPCSSAVPLPTARAGLGREGLIRDDELLGSGMGFEVIDDGGEGAVGEAAGHRGGAE